MKDLLKSFRNFKYPILGSVIALLIIFHFLLVYIEVSNTESFISNYSERIAGQIDEAVTSVNLFQLKNLLRLLHDDRISYLNFITDHFKKNGLNDIRIGASGINVSALDLKRNLEIVFSGHSVGSVTFVINLWSLSLLVFFKYLWIYALLTILFLVQSFSLSLAPLLVIKRIETFLKTILNVRQGNQSVTKIELGIKNLDNGRFISYRSSVLPEISKMIVNLLNLESDLVKMRVSSEIYKQIGHDLKSPIASLNMILTQLQNLPEQHRLIVRSSVNRISDIANSLLSRSKDGKKIDSDPTKGSSSESVLENELIPALVDLIVSEKRTQYRDKIGVEIESDLKGAYGAFAKINQTELKRALSNLIGNAVEALSNSKGRVVAAVGSTSEFVTISVRDSGTGIPQHILAKLGTIGVTFGKEGTGSGSGLGVYHAKKTIESFGGKFAIDTKEGMGTTISLHLPKAHAPIWFVESLFFSPNQQVISLDDDFSIHGIWKGRFESQRLNEVGIQHLTFTSGDEFKNFIQMNGISEKRIYLMDYELLNQPATGLDLIEEMGIGDQSILVSSRYEELNLRERCQRLKVKLIPKAMAAHVPIEIEKPKESIDSILIDDDSLVHSFWQMDATSKGKKFVGFYNPADFMKQASKFDTTTKVFVDSNLGNGIKGEAVSKEIHDLGFKNIYICTGYQASDFQPMPWVQDIIGKDPVF